MGYVNLIFIVIGKKCWVYCDMVDIVLYLFVILVVGGYKFG